MSSSGKTDSYHKIKLGIFGGTFDPPHIGHLILAAEAVNQYGLDRVLWVLTPDPPHKKGQTITPCEVRLELLQAAISGDAHFELSRVDIDRSPPYYAYETVQLLRAQYPDASVSYLMGGDSLCDLPTWHKPRQFLKACDQIIVMKRQSESCVDVNLEVELPGIGKKVCYLEFPYIEIASSRIRALVAENKIYRYYLPERVAFLLEDKRLYRKQSGSK